jgi:erythromycin esterase-like protein
MHKPFFILIAFCWTSFVNGQDSIKKYVQENTVQIKAIEPDSTDYSDLEAFGNAIGNSKIVMLGEQDHGDAATFLAKTRLIKYLHQKKGFNVLAFESDFFGLNYGWDFVKNGKLNCDSFILKNIYPLWTYCNACKNLFTLYIPSSLKTNNPLEITGFDNQVFTKPLYPILDSVLRKLKIPITKQTDYSSTILPFLQSWGKFTNDSISNTKVNNYLIEIKSQLLRVLPDTNFWVMTVDNLIQQNIEFRNLGKYYRKDGNTRDRQMALNLNWLDKVKYPNEKIIVWAHSYHISKFAGHYPDDFMNTAMPMGSVFTADTLNLKTTYVLGFTSYEGTAGRLFKNKTYKIDKPKENGFENWIDKSFEYAFVDFKKYNSKYANTTDNFYMSGAVKGNWYHKNDKAQWNKIFDGVFYIKTMFPCKE